MARVVNDKLGGGGKKSQTTSSNTTDKNKGLTQRQRDAYRKKTDQLLEEQEKKVKEYDEYLKRKREEEEQKTYAEQTMQLTELIEKRRQIQQLMEEAEMLKSSVLKAGDDFNAGYGGSRAVLVEGYSNNLLSKLDGYIETLKAMEAKLAEEQSKITGENIATVTDTRKTTESVEINHSSTMYYDSVVLKGEVLPQYDNIDAGLKQMFDNLWSIQGIGEYEGMAEYRMQALSDIENMQETNGRLKDNVQGIVDSVEIVERENQQRQREIAERKTAAILGIATREEQEEIDSQRELEEQERLARQREIADRKTAAILGIATREEQEEIDSQKELEEQERLERQREIARRKMDQLLEEKAKSEKEYEEILKQKEQEEQAKREQERKRRAVFFNKQNQLLGAEGNLTVKELEELADHLLGDYLEPGKTYDKYAMELDQIYLRYAMEGNYSNLDKDINDLLDRLSAELEEKEQKEREKQKGQSHQGGNPKYYGYGTDITYNPTEEKNTDGTYVNGYKAYIPDTVGTDNPPKTIIIDFHGKGGGNLSYEDIAKYGLMGAIEESDLANPNAYILTPRVNSATTVEHSPWVAMSSAEEMASLIDEFLADQGLNREDVNIVFAGNSAGGQACLYMATKLPDYCDGVIAMDAVVFNGYDKSVPELKVPVIGYGGTQSKDGFHQNMNKNISKAIGEENMTIVESTHGDLPKNAYNIDKNNNGISDMFENFDFIPTNVEGVRDNKDSNAEEDAYGKYTDITNQENPYKALKGIDNMSEAELEILILNLAKQEGIDTQGKTISDMIKEIANKYDVSLTKTKGDALPIPLYNQMDYAYTRYGYGTSTVKTSGCGIAAYAMVLSYLLDREILPCDLVVRNKDEIDGYHKDYNRYYVEGKGSSYTLFTDTAEADWGVSVEKCFWDDAWNQGKLEEALRNGQPVIAAVSPNSPFTEAGHYIVLTGITEDGRVLVNDPNGFNYESNANVNGEGKLKDLLAGEGFYLDDFRSWGGPYFIFERKETSDIAVDIPKSDSEILGEIADKMQETEQN